MKLLHWLQAVEEFSGELLINGFESRYSFDFGKDYYSFTPYFKRKYATILNAPIAITNNVIDVKVPLNDEDSESMVDEFNALFAGYVVCSEFDKCFVRSK